MRSRTIAVAGLLAVTGPWGCYGGRNDMPAEDDGGGDDEGGDDEGEPEPAPLGCDGSAFDPGPARLRRLTHAEYTQTVRDLLGVDPAAQVALFPADVTTGSFDNDAQNQTISVLLGEGYLEAAQTVAAAVVADPERRDAVLGCDPGTGTECLRSAVEGLGRRAWRRPLEATEVDELLALTVDEATPAEQASIMIEALLLSPKFLFRVELGRPTADDPTLLQLTGYEVATRLSYFLWGTTPDDALLDAAAAGELDDADGVAEHARRMLADERARRALRDFSEQWFRVRDIEDQYRDPAAYPGWGPELAQSMREELALLLDDYMWSSEGFLGIYTADHGYADARLAEVYGLAPRGDALEPVSWEGDEERGGLLTTAAFATASSRAGDTSPVTRAVYVREVMLCDPPPPPPADIPLIEPEEGESAQDAFERHTADPACAGCHLTLDPIGHGLERYDSIGQLRQTYPDGSPVRLAGEVRIDDRPVEFAGGVALGQAIAGSEAAAGCAVAHAYRFALGRQETEVDACSMERLTAAFTASEQVFEPMLIELVTSDAFRFRRAHEG
jgi:Protein of unknown function (DUF1592)/Protein of unknown function (DUF1588)/Protein of unknown function (DUF1587)/Protein of unknown function (DUF1595)/Protein of unknown function (DUF1585)